MNKFDEREHPRAEDGKFTSGGGYRQNASYEDILRSDEKGLTGTKESDRIKLIEAQPQEFLEQIVKAKESNTREDRWRVDIHSEADYAGDKLFTTEGGSSVAVEPDGNIISVCKNQNGGERGVAKALLEKVIAEGGDRLDAFGKKLYKTYTSNGFEPVSWTLFDEQCAPEGWVKGRDDPESVVFYKYTGKQTKLSYEEFLRNTPASKGYDDAKALRDKEIKR